MVVARIFFSFLMAGQLLVAGLIIGLVATKLNSIKLGFDAQNLSASMQDTCLLGSAPNGVNLCYVAYGFSGVSILASGALSLLMCCTCNLCGLGFLLDTIFAAAGTAWWAVAGVVFNYYSQQPNIAALPQAQARHWIVILCWVACALFGVAFLINLYRMLATCCACCGGGGKSGRRDIESGGNGGGRWRAKAAPPAVIHSIADGPPPGYPNPGRRGGRAAPQAQFITSEVANNSTWTPQPPARRW